MILQTQIRAYLRAIPGLPEDEQEAMANKHAPDQIYRWGEGKRSTDARARWINSLRDGDTALVADLRCLIKPKPPRTDRPQLDLADTIISIVERGAIILEMRTGIRSDDKARWPERRKAALAQAAQGERNQRDQRRALMKARGKRGLSLRWRSASMAKDKELAARIWRDPIYPTWREAQAALPEELHGVSLRTLYTIFGVRNPNDKRAGGRPRKTKK